MLPSDILRAELGDAAEAHRGTLEELKQILGITHNYLDCWLYSFLENKHFDISETQKKLDRRAQMELRELATHKITQSLYDGLTRGTIQTTGRDKRGRLCLYVTTARDFPTAAVREESLRAFDMILSYATALRGAHRNCRVVILVNQERAALMANVDMALQAAVALRVSKYYPGLIERVYLVNMSRLLAAMMRPLFRQFPKAIAERMRIVTDRELRSGALMQWFDASVVPVALGGANVSDTPKDWVAFANAVTKHFRALQNAVTRNGMSVKEWELAELHNSESENRERETTELSEAKRLTESEAFAVLRDRRRAVAQRECTEAMKETAKQKEKENVFSFALGTMRFVWCGMALCAFAIVCLPVSYKEIFFITISWRDRLQIGMFFALGFLSGI